MIKTYIVDDEIDSINSISLILKEYCENVEIIGTAASMKDALNEIPACSPDLLILDIEMPFGSGFDLLEHLTTRNFETIFVTAYNNYAIKAIKYSAIDYVLKPVDIDELKIAVKRVEQKLNNKIKKNPDYSVLLENAKNKIPDKIAINSFDSIIYINYNDIIRMEGNGSYTNIFTGNGKKVLVSRTLKDFQELLADRNIFRPHNSHIINIEHVISFRFKDGGYIEMSDGTSVPVSRRKKEEFLEIMSKFAK